MDEVNPFAPPAAPDSEVVPERGAKSDRVMTSDALHELRATWPWMRWSARLAILGLVVGVANTLFELRASWGSSKVVVLAVSSAIFLPLSVAFVVLIRRSSIQMGRFLTGDAAALAGALGAQRAYIRMTVIVVLLAMGLTIGIAVVAFLLRSFL